MSAFTNGFNIGFVSGMFNRMFGSFNPFCGCNFFGGFNFTPTFFTPMMNTSLFSSYSMPVMNFSLPNYQMTTPIFDTSNFNANYSFNPTSTMMDTFTPSYNYSTMTMPTTVSSSSSKKKTTSSGSASDSSNSSSKTTKAKNYTEMSDAEMRRIYGNYTKSMTSTYSGTAEDLNKTLAKYGVLAGKGQAFINAQKKYGINASILAAICIQETGGKSNNAKNKNNVSNISQGSGWRTYSSVEACIEDTARRLKQDYVDKGLDCLYKVNAKYCPVQDTRGSAASQSAWAGKVDQISSQIERA